MRDVVIVDAVRTPHGKGKSGGALADVHPVTLLAGVPSTLVERTQLDPGIVEDVITGCVSQVGEQAMNFGRHAVLAAGFPESVPATTIDRQCGSSQQAVHFAAQGVMAGAYDVAIACGVESMSRVRIGSPSLGADPAGPQVRHRYAPGLVHQGVSAELIAAKWRLSREDLDAFSVKSYRRAHEAFKKRAFKREVVSLASWSRKLAAAEQLLDEPVRADTSMESLGVLKPAFYDPDVAERFPEIQWSITAGNSSPLTDGASAVLIMSADKASALGLTPRARFHAFAVVGSDPVIMLTGPLAATELVLSRAHMSIEDLNAYEVNAYEVNEAFAPVPLMWQRHFDADPDRLNVRGGAIALGHPLGSSGTRLLTTLLGVLEDHEGRFGLQTICEGGGLANATIIERL